MNQLDFIDLLHTTLDIEYDAETKEEFTRLKPVKLIVGSKLVDLTEHDIYDNGDYIIIGQ